MAIKRRILSYSDFKKTKKTLENPEKHPIKESADLSEKKMTDDAKDFISKKIKKLVGEGRPQKQAIAMAYSYAKKEGYEVPEANESEQHATFTPQEEMMKLLNKRFPNIWTKKGDEFDKEHKGTIWTGAEGSTFIDRQKKIPAFNPSLAMSHNPYTKNYIDETHKILVEFLKKHGWYSMSYDPGTFFFHPIQ